MAQPVKTNPVVEKPLTCAWWVWKAGKNFEWLVEVTRKALEPETLAEETEKFFEYVRRRLPLLEDSLLKVENYCGINLSTSKELLRRAEDHILRYKLYEAEWSLLDSWRNMLNELEFRVKAERGEV